MSIHTYINVLSYIQFDFCFNLSGRASTNTPNIPICWWILEVFVEALSHSQIATLYKVNLTISLDFVQRLSSINTKALIYQHKGSHPSTNLTISLDLVDFVQSVNMWMAKSLHEYCQYPSTYWDKHIGWLYPYVQRLSVQSGNMWMAKSLHELDYTPMYKGSHPSTQHIKICC